MLLQRLNEYASRLDLPPTLYSEAPVRYIIELSSDGSLRNTQPTDTADSSNARTRRGTRLLVPQIQRAVGIKPLLLADNAEYTLGLAREDSKPARVANCHVAYMELLDRCFDVTQDSVVNAVRAFLHSEAVSQLNLGDDYDRGAIITFRVNGTFPVDLPSVQNFWATDNDPGVSTAQPAAIMQCIVCGQERPVLTRLQGKIKGVPGGQTAGTALISANAAAFESYGLDASLIAPTCATCGERFTKAANDLLASQSSRIIIGGAAFIFWTREKVDFDFLSFFNDPEPTQVRDLLSSVRTGQRLPDVDDTAFYATALSGSGGRVVVRDWIDTTVGQVRENLAKWFARQQVVDAFGEAPRPLKLYLLAVGTVREGKDLPATTPRALLHSALTGAPLPYGLLYQAVRRNRAEQGMTRQRAALIKLVLLSQQPDTVEDRMIQLDPENMNPAYRCGRLLAVLEETQRQAIGKATIVERFFGTASSAPASVFGRLLRGAQPHLSKLERDRPGAYRALQNRLEEVQGGLSGFPRTLMLEDQAIFALGYYHQRAYDRGQARENAERRKAEAAQQASTNAIDDSAEQGNLTDETDETID